MSAGAAVEPRSRLTRIGVIVKAIVVFALFASSTAAASGWEQRVDDFTKKTTAQRQKLGLDKLSPEEEAQRYPTPEAHFDGQEGGGDQAFVLCPGKARPLTISGNL